MKQSAPSDDKLTFPWKKPRGMFLVLPGFLALSLIAHAATFFLFQVVYPQRVSIPRPAPQVSLLLPSVPEHRSILRRIEAEDPALIATTAGAEPDGLLEVPYRPSFAAIRTAPRAIAEATPASFFPPARPPLAIIRSAAPPPAAQALLHKPQPTTLSIAGPLKARFPANPPTLALREKSTTPLEPAEFLIGVTERGEVRYTFLQKSSGAAAIDDEAATHLRALTFLHGDSPIAWGFVSFAWGDDAHESKPPSK